MFRILAHASLAMQTAFSCLLVCLLEFYYRRVAQEAWLRWFAGSWVAQAAYAASLWVVFDYPSGGALIRASISLLGFGVPATFVLTSIALLRGGNPTRAWIGGVYGAAAIAAGIRFAASLPYPADGVQASRIHNVPTFAFYGLASLLAAFAFIRHGREHRLAGSLVTGGAWALYAIFNLLRAGLWLNTTTWALYRAENDPALMQFALLTFIGNSTVWIVMSIGVGLLLTERAERSESRTRSTLRELQESQNERGRLARLVEQSRDAILVVSEGRVRYLNPAAASLLGYSADEIPSLFLKSLEEMCAIAVDDPMRQTMPTALVSTGVWEGQSEWTKHGNGERIPVLVGAVTMEAREGQPACTGLIGRDLRERLRLEDDLRQSQRQEALGRLASGIAHDFNNLLAVVMGYASLALEDNLSDRLREIVGEILTASRRAAAITGRLRAFGRRQALRATTFDLNVLVRGMRGALDQLVEGEVELVLDLCATPLPVRADAAQIEQVVMNLALNARQAIERKGRVRIRTRSAGAFAQLQVEDTGCGIESGVLEHIFDPYFTTRSAGTGLGLSMAYGIIGQSGGQIQVESCPGQGSVFTVSLPASEADLGTSQTDIGNDPPAHGENEWVMVVDDRPDVAALVKACLTHYGYRVLSYTDSDSAVAALRDGAPMPNLVIRDVMMPGMALPEFADRLRQMRPGLPIMCMSGLPEASVSGVIEKTGGYFISKPFKPEQLAAMVRRVLDANAILTRD